MGINLDRYEFSEGLAILYVSSNQPWVDQGQWSIEGVDSDGQPFYQVGVLIPYSDELRNIWIFGLRDGVYTVYTDNGDLSIIVDGETITVFQQPAITASAYLTAGGSAIIDLWCPIGWSSGAWSVSLEGSDLPSYSYVDLFDLWTRSGVGTVDGQWLHVEIARMKTGQFVLNTVNGSKRFELNDGESYSDTALVGFNGIGDYVVGADISAYNPFNYIPVDKSFVYFGSKLEPFAGRQQAQLQLNDELHGIAIGRAVDEMRSEDLQRYWSIPAIIFNSFYWLKPPVGPTTYKLVMPTRRRGGSSEKLLSFDVTVDLESIYSPLGHPVYDMSRVYDMSASMTKGGWAS